MNRVDCKPTETIIEIKVDVDADGKPVISDTKQVERPCQRCGGMGFYYE